MSDFQAIDALLASASSDRTPLPPAEERRQLREGLHLSRAQLATALGVGASTVGGWESGWDPSGEVREKYAYFLDGARTKLDAAAVTATAPVGDPADAPAEADQAVDTDDFDALAAPQPCVLCGQPARHQVEGFPQHLDSAECGAAEPVQAEKCVSEPAAQQTSRQLAPAERQDRPARGVRVVPVGRRVQAASDTPDLIGSAVAAALAEHAGDVEAALVKRAIPDAMALLDHTRKGCRYDIVAHPWLPEILRKQTARGADQVWEARPKWTRPELPAGWHEVTALDINGAYLSALKTHLPLGQLEHSTGDHHDRRRAGVHLITPPVWDHDAVLPNPIGTRVEIHPLNQSQVDRPRQRVVEFRTLNVRHWDRIVAAWVAGDDQEHDDAWVDQVIDLGSQWGQYEYVTNVGFAV
ncbi:helix-turn-helix domain-containing protein [Streptomyces sp. NBC_00271]|uniref:helix-turn-helix domain-containing protein n=1 Tax=Streptomyces sp. NBC_00271 TaxID=2975697 RepID=UPI003FA6BCB9